MGNCIGNVPELPLEKNDRSSAWLEAEIVVITSNTLFERDLLKTVSLMDT